MCAVATRCIRFSGLKVIVEQIETVQEHNFYSATTVFGGQEKNYSPLLLPERPVFNDQRPGAFSYPE